MRSSFSNALKVLVFFNLVFFVQSAGAQARPFRFHLFNEPQSLDPQVQRSSNASYVISNLFRNFYWYDDAKGLVPDLGEKCTRPRKLLVRCRLKKNLKWSDGSALTAQDFADSFKRLLSPEQQAPRADLLFKIKNAKEYFQGKVKSSELGIRVVSPLEFETTLAAEDPDFEYNLANSLTAPTKTFPASDKIAMLVTSGPYKVKSWIRGDRISLESNPYYGVSNASPAQRTSPSPRPAVQVRFIEVDSVALRLYEKNELDLLRRLPTLFLQKWKDSKEFNWIAVIRFDYFGFGPALADQLSLRKALSHSLNFPELQKIFGSDGVPGCAGIPDAWVNSLPCLKQDLGLAKKQEWDKKIKLLVKYSVQGGDDHKRALEWFQSEWKANLGLDVAAQAQESKIYTAELKLNPPPIFRRGVSPDRATCLSVLETFTPNNPDNFIRMKEDRYFRILEELSHATSLQEKKDYCQKGIEFLLQNYYLIPTGGIHFAILAKPSFTGWKLNGMNQLDLANLVMH